MADRHHHGGDRADQRQHLHELGEGIGQEGAAVSFPLAGLQDEPEAGDDEKGNRKAGDGRGRLFTGEHADHQERHRADREDQLGDRELQASEEGFSSHVQSRPVVIAPKAQRFALPAGLRSSC
ncbi:hypothetical protein D3C72_1665630 [compost metagenome]